MNPIRQSAGLCEVEVYTDGSPFFPYVRIGSRLDPLLEARVTVDELHDLRYCIDRVLSQLPHRK